VFLVEAGAVVALERMTIRHGRPSAEEEHGGGIDNYGVLTLKNCVVTKNSARGGGGISNRQGTLTIIGSTFSDNVARGDGPLGEACGGGGGVKCSSGRMTLVASTIAGNQAGLRSEGLGGGVRTGCGCVTEIVNSTISGNEAVRYGGGIAASGKVTITNCTITNNRVGSGGGALWVRGEVNIENTIIAKNRGGKNCTIGGEGGHVGTGSVVTNRNNLIGDGSCEPDFSGDPMLSHLDDNGGDTLTHALLPGSPAIDAVPAISCTLPTDQRGGLRPVAQTSPGTPCDIGAFEVQPETPAETSPAAAPSSHMLLVPAGEFTMGSDEGRGDERPVHTVSLDAFAIDETEVTNAQFARFLNERGNREEGGETWLDVDDEDCLIKNRGSHFQPKSGSEDHPVIEVTWYGARAYCEWRGEGESDPLRLPTEAEWEKAASWDPAAGVKRVYPWGDAWDSGTVNADWPITTTTELRPHTALVGSHPEGASPYGMLDMAGNVWEWVTDWYASDYYEHSPSHNPQGPDAGEDKVLRGGSWRSTREFVRTTVRHHWYPDYTFDIGFRCARSWEGTDEP
jgi:predicted outer membrane repeat protein